MQAILTPWYSLLKHPNTTVYIMTHNESPSPLSWASASGEDQYGFWLDTKEQEIIQRFRWINAGTFLMGSPETEAERMDTENQHAVTLTKGFWIADTTVSQAFWEQLMGNNPSRFQGEQLPVDSITWHDATKFIEKLNCYNQSTVYSLPTEAQWEYACRAGTLTPFSFGEQINSNQVNFDGTAPYDNGSKSADRRVTINAQELPPNAWGLYGMHGNIWEWCQDWYAEYPSIPAQDPNGATKGLLKVLRGGSWFYSGRHCRSATRAHAAPDDAGIFLDYGFRLVINP